MGGVGGGGSRARGLPLTAHPPPQREPRPRGGRPEPGRGEPRSAPAARGTAASRRGAHRLPARSVAGWCVCARGRSGLTCEADLDQVQRVEHQGGDDAAAQPRRQVLQLHVAERGPHGRRRHGRRLHGARGPLGAHRRWRRRQRAGGRGSNLPPSPAVG